MYSEPRFPVQVRYPKTVEQPLTEQDPSSYPLTLTFKAAFRDRFMTFPPSPQPFELPKRLGSERF